MNERAIGIDFDGIAWPIVDALGSLPDCPKLDGQPLSYANCATWDTVVEIWGPEFNIPFAMSKLDEARQLEVMRRFGFYDGFIYALETFRMNGLEPTILSHNTDESIRNVRAFLDEHAIDAPLISAKPKEKVEWCLERQAALVDDAPDTIRLAHEHGVQVATIRYLYNAEAIDETGAVWGRDWSELLPLTLMAVGVSSPRYPDLQQAVEQAPQQTSAPAAYDLSL